MEKNKLSLRGKNVLGLEDFSPEEIRLVLDTAKEMKNIIHR
ncbi:MAG: aspartate carbamoyltransferase, partial [Selenomonas ruminantium]|nr:aspartate carbamoyltransferase [Selenomonas ruminantium]